MDDVSAKIAMVCQCIDHCFAFAVWCDDFAKCADPDDRVWGLDRAVSLVSDATRLQSFVALRKLDDFLAAKSKSDDLVAADFGIDAAGVLDSVGERLLAQDERTNINKGAAHLTGHLTLEADAEVDLQAIIERSIPVFTRLAVALRAVDTKQEATHWLDGTEALIKLGQAR